MKLIEKNIDFKMILKNICNVKFSRFQENIVERGPVNRSRHNLIKRINNWQGVSGNFAGQL